MKKDNWQQLILLIWTFMCLLIELLDAPKVDSFDSFIATIFATIITGWIYYCIGLLIIIIANGMYKSYRIIVARVTK